MLRTKSLLVALVVSSTAFSTGIITMRHGEGEHNVYKFFNSSPKNPGYRVVHLTETGKKQASASAESLEKKGYKNENVRAIYVSPLPRTQETAQFVIDALKIAPDKKITSDLITEVDFGKYEGKLIQQFPWEHVDLSHGHDYGGETEEDIAKRVQTLLKKILAECDTSSNVVIVTHGAPGRHIIEYLTGKSGAKMLKTAQYEEVSWDKIYATKNAPKCKK